MSSIHELVAAARDKAIQRNLFATGAAAAAAAAAAGLIALSQGNPDAWQEPLETPPPQQISTEAPQAPAAEAPKSETLESSKADLIQQRDKVLSHMMDLSSELAKAQAAVDSRTALGADNCPIPLLPENLEQFKVRLHELQAQLRSRQEEKLKIENALGSDSIPQTSEQLFSRYAQLANEIKASPDAVAARPGALNEVNQVFKEMNAKFLAAYLANSSSDWQAQQASKANLIELQDAVEKLYVPSSRAACNASASSAQTQALAAKQSASAEREPASQSTTKGVR